ncbi:MAG: hypothetical protein U5L95_00740 [Candidatus Saccharibacteria bacterium]|nr:hypothetical protein [Candidatus Saccharibacteria bacterium]
MTFTEPFKGGASPKVVISANNRKSAHMPVFVERDQNGFTIYVDQTLEADETYEFDFVVIGAEEVAAN